MTDATSIAARVALAAVDWAAGRVAGAVVKRIERRVTTVTKTRIVSRLHAHRAADQDVEPRSPRRRANRTV